MRLSLLVVSLVWCSLHGIDCVGGRGASGTSVGGFGHTVGYACGSA